MINIIVQQNMVIIAKNQSSLGCAFVGKTFDLSLCINLFDFG